VALPDGPSLFLSPGKIADAAKAALTALDDTLSHVIFVD